jgi:hypothetical protein
MDQALRNYRIVRFSVNAHKAIIAQARIIAKV